MATIGIGNLLAVDVANAMTTPVSDLAPRVVGPEVPSLGVSGDLSYASGVDPANWGVAQRAMGYTIGLSSLAPKPVDQLSIHHSVEEVAAIVERSVALVGERPSWPDQSIERNRDIVSLDIGKGISLRVPKFASENILHGVDGALDEIRRQMKSTHELLFESRQDPETGQPVIEHGLIAWDPDDPYQFAVLPACMFEPSLFVVGDDGRVLDVEFNGPSLKSRIQRSMAVSSNLFTISGLAQNLLALRAASDKTLEQVDASGELNGALWVGFEYEVFLIDPETGDLDVNVAQKEFLKGTVENDQDKHLSPVSAGLAIAKDHLNLVHTYPNHLVVSLSVVPSGDPQNIEVNTDFDSEAGRHIAASLEHRLTTYEADTPTSYEVMRQLAMFKKHKTVEEMFEMYQGGELHSALASHFNIGLPHVRSPRTGDLQIDGELARNVANMVFSELGAMIRIFCASGAYLSGFAPLINDQPIRDVREIIRNNIFTALPQNKPLKDGEHILSIVRQLVLGDLAVELLPRMIIAHTLPDGTMMPSHHGTGRMHFEHTGEMSGRVEYIGAGATSILPKISAMSLLQILEYLGMIATHKGVDSLELAAELIGCKPESVWGNAEQVAQDFSLNGPNAVSMRVVSYRLRKLIARLFEEYPMPVLNEPRAIALAGLQAVRFEGDLFDFAGGVGTLGGAQAYYAKLKDDEGNPVITGLDMAKMIHAFEYQEALAVANWTRKQRLKYFTRKKRFPFQMPDLPGKEQYLQRRDLKRGPLSLI